MDRAFFIRITLLVMVLFGSVYFWLLSFDDINGDYVGQEDKINDVKTEFRGLVSKFIPVSVFDFMQNSWINEKTYCPYVNPFMSELISTGELEAGESSPIKGFFEYAMVKSGAGLPEAGCDKVLAEYLYDVDEYNLTCSHSNHYTSTEISIPDLAEFSNDYVSEDDSEFNFSLSKKVPNWQCFLFFGLLPFITMVFFLKDILKFTMLSSRVKSMLVFFASAITIMMGLFAKFVWQLAYIASLSIGSSFIIVMLVMVFISVIMNWLSSITSAFAEGRTRAAKVGVGIAQGFTQAGLVGEVPSESPPDTPASRGLQPPPPPPVKKEAVETPEVSEEDLEEEDIEKDIKDARDGFE